jgi:hypothetical protein
MKDSECSESAIEFLNIIWRSMQYLDDKYDDMATKTSTHLFIKDVFFALQHNQFYIENFKALSSALYVMVAKWEAANFAETSGTHNALSFMWRAGYYDLVLLVYYLCKGYDNGMYAAYNILSMYGESLVDYLEEFKRCPTP